MRPLTVLVSCFIATSRRARKALFLLAVASTAHAQTVRLSGVVLDEQRLPLAGATVMLGPDARTTTSPNGRFDLGGVSQGRYMLTVTAVGFEIRTLSLSLERDTSLTVTMTRAAVTLDTLLVRPRNLRIRATAVDSATGDFLLQAQATLYPGGRFESGASGVLVFDSVTAGQVTLVVEGLEHLPKRIDLTLTRDTVFQVPLAVDSVALRMIAAQVRRLVHRSQTIPLPIATINHDAIRRAGAVSLQELIIRRTYENPTSVRRSLDAPPGAGCFFVDDMKVSRGVYDGMVPDLVERVEIYRSSGAPHFENRSKTDRNFGSVAMIRVYTKRYVASLAAKEEVPRILFLTTGLAKTCA